MNSEVHELTTFELDSAEQKKSGLFSKFFQRFRTSISAQPESPVSSGVSSPKTSGQDQYMTFQEYTAARDEDQGLYSRSLNRNRRNSTSNNSQVYSPYIMAKNSAYLSSNGNLNLSGSYNNGRASLNRYNTNVNTNNNSNNNNNNGSNNNPNYTQNVIATSTIINGNPNAPDSSTVTPTLTNNDPETPILNPSGMNRRPSVSSIASVNTESSAIVPTWNANNNNHSINNLRSTSNTNAKSRILNHVPHFSTSVFHSNSNNPNVSTVNNSENNNYPPSNNNIPTTPTDMYSSPNTTTAGSNPVYFASNIRNFPTKNYANINAQKVNNTNAIPTHRRISSLTSSKMNGNMVSSFSNSSISSNATRYSNVNGNYANSINSNTNSNTTINPGSYTSSNIRIKSNNGGTVVVHRRKSSVKSSDITLAESLAMAGPTTISTSFRNQRSYGALSHPSQNYNSNGNGGGGPGGEESLRRSNSRSSFDSVTSQNSNPDKTQRSMKLISMLKNGESKQYWMQDENCKQCYECKTNFNTFRRKHHCRICGQIFCYKCASATISGEKFGYSGTLRVCNYCLKLTQNYRNEQNHSHESYPTSATLASSMTYQMPKTPVHVSSNMNINNSNSNSHSGHPNTNTNTNTNTNANTNINTNTNTNTNTTGVDGSWSSKYMSISPDQSYLDQMKRKGGNSIPPYQHQLIRSKSSLAAIEDMDSSILNTAPFINKNEGKSLNGSNDTLDQDIVPYITDENGDVVIAADEEMGEVLDEEWIHSPILSYISSSMIASNNKLNNTIVDDAISNPGTPLPTEYYSSDEEDSDLVSVKSLTNLNKIPNPNKSRDDLHVTFLKNQKRKRANSKLTNRVPKFTTTIAANGSTDDLTKTIIKPINNISYILPIEDMNSDDSLIMNIPPSDSLFNKTNKSPLLLNSSTNDLFISSNNINNNNNTTHLQNETFVLPLNIELNTESYFHMV